MGRLTSSGLPARLIAAACLAFMLFVVPLAGIDSLSNLAASPATELEAADQESSQESAASPEQLRDLLDRLGESMSSLRVRSPEAKVRAAWKRASKADGYQFTADVKQTVTPRVTIYAAGTGAKEQRLYLEGEAHPQAGELDLTLWGNGGSVLDEASGLEVRVAGNEASARQAGQDWKPIPNFAGAFAPQGDLLAFIGAVDDVSALGTEGAAVDGTSTLQGFSFRLDGNRLAELMRDEMTRRLDAEGGMPPNMTLGKPDVYAEMVGHGRLWIDEHGLPVRQELHLELPPGRDEADSVSEATIHFFDFAESDVGRFALSGIASVGPGTTVAGYFGYAVEELPKLSYLLLALALCTLFVRHWQSKRLYSSLSVVIVVCLLITPVLQAANGRLFVSRLTREAEASEAATQPSKMQQQLGSLMDGPEWNPKVSPLAQAGLDGVDDGTQRLARPDGSSSADGAYSSQASAVEAEDGDEDAEAEECDDADTGDGDEDGLTEFQECLLALRDDAADTDGDNIDDDVEVAGFEFPAGSGQMWYTDPADPDSNDDGLDDGREWNTGREEGDPPPDTDGDGTPDLFDRDNDDDLVPDNLDVSPYYNGSKVYSADAPFQYVLDSLTAGEPVVAEFQIRPTDPKHLWYAFNVLDWPSDDDRGQVQDVDGRTFYDEDRSTDRFPNDNGDIKLVPMLEILITGSPDNLPSEDDLEAYGISVNELDGEGNDKAAYVPLTLVVEPKGDTRVAFAGRMRYEPSDAWGNAHQVRLVWVVQALTDVCRSYDDGKCVSWESRNEEKVVHTYAEDEWTLTGMSVREDRGTDMAVAYEDPDVDGDKDDDSGLMFLTRGLELTFLAGSDCEEWDDKGTDEPEDDVCVRGDDERDITVPEIHRRFNHETNDGVSITDTWRIPDKVGDIFTVVTDTYRSRDEAVATVSTDTVEEILDGDYTDHRPIVPTLLFAREERFRTLNLDEDVVGEDAPIAWSEGDRQLEMDLDESDVPEQTVAGINWAPYRYRNGEWESYPIEDYWEKLEDRFSEAFADEYDDEEDPDEVRDGAVFVGQIYYLTMFNGVSVLVQTGDELVIQEYQTNDKPLAASISKLGAKAVLAVVQIWVMRNFQYSTKALRFLSNVGYSVTQEARKSFQPTAVTIGNIVRWWKNVGKWIGLKGAVTVGVMVLIAALAVGVYYLAKAYMAGVPEAVYSVTVLVGAILAYLWVIAPIMTAVGMINALVASGQTAVAAVGKVLSASSEFIGMSKIMSIIGLAIGLGVIVGVFIYALVKEEGLRNGLGFSLLLAQTIAAAMFLVLSVVLSLTIVGAIIMGILSLVDTIMVLLGSDWTISGVVTEALTKTFFSYELAVHDDRDDLLVMSELDSDLVEPEHGIVPGAMMEFTTTVRNNVLHRRPYDERTGYYLWKYDDNQIRSTSFEYELGAGEESIEASLWDTNRTRSWHVSEAYEIWGHQMYEGWVDKTLTAGSAIGDAGVNSSVPLVLSSGFALPGLECWSLPGLYWILPIIVCVDTGLESDTSSDLGQNIVLDVFPRTLDEFVDVASWAPRIKFVDVDGDGLRAQEHGGTDPDDTNPDIDGDLLTDGWELEMASKEATKGGLQFAVDNPDTDGDGLNDQEEAHLGTDPELADTDGDGISDAAELEGWDFYYDYPTKTRVHSDPLNADVDGDGMDDLFERTLHTECSAEATEADRRDCYNDNLFSPYSWNTNPIGVYTEIGETDLVVKPSQSFAYSTTVQNNIETGSPLWVRGETILDASPLTGDPTGMTFDIAKGKAQTLNAQLTVPSGTTNQDVTLLTTVESELHTPSVWAWDPWGERVEDTDSPKAGYLDVMTVEGWNTQYIGVSRENYVVRGYSIASDGFASGPHEIMDQSGEQPTSKPAVACNASGRCRVVYSYESESDSSYRLKWKAVQGVWDVASWTGSRSESAGWQAWGATVASDGTDFLMAWMRKQTGAKELRVHHLYDDTTTGAAITVDTATEIGFPAVDWAGDHYLIVYERDDDIYLASVTEDTIGTPEALSDTSASESYAGVAYDALSGRSLVTYLSRTPGHRSLRGRTVSGSNVSDEFVIANVSDQAGWEHAVSADPVNGGWVVAWGLNGKHDVYSVGVGMSGDVRGDRDTIATAERNYQLDVACGEPKPEHYYEFEEDAGATTFADSAWGHDARWDSTHPSSPDPVNAGEPGKRGKAVWFKGNDNYLIADAELTKSGGTVMLWIKADCETCGIVSFGARSGEKWRDRQFYLQDGKLCASLSQQDICSTADHYADGEWHHVVHTFGSRIGGQRLYADKVQVASGSKTSSYKSGSRELRIGYALGAAVQVGPGEQDHKPQFIGTIDELKVYHHAVSEGEIKNDYYDPLVVYAMDEVSGATTFNNSSGSGLDAGECSYPGCPQAGRQGKAHKALRFDGSNDRVTGADVPIDNSSFTIAAWARREATGAEEYIVSQGSPGSGRDLFMGFWSNDKFVCGFDSGDVLSTPLSYTDTDWHHWACSYDYDTGDRSIYRDGERVANDATSHYIGKGSLRVGQARWGNHWRGMIDEFAIWPDPLPADEIETLYEKVKALDDSVTECQVGRSTSGGEALHLHRSALHETTTPLGRSEQEVEDEITVDATLPTARITSLADEQHISPVGELVVSGEADDNTFVRSVELSVDGGAWETADGAETWSYAWDTSGYGEGNHTLRVRATDPADNTSNPTSIRVFIDRTPPQLSVTSVRRKAIRQSNGSWKLEVKGDVVDETDGRLSVLLQGEHRRRATDTADRRPSGGGWQNRNYTSNGTDPRAWTLNYLVQNFDNEGNALPHPSGVYTVQLRARDIAGNATDVEIHGRAPVDNTAPVAELESTGAYTDVIVGPSTVLTGTVTDYGDEAVGIGRLYVKFEATREQDGRFYYGYWYWGSSRAALESSGPGVTYTTWSLDMPIAEGFFPMKLEASDVAPVPYTSGGDTQWNGMVDTAGPRVDPYLKVLSYPFGPTEVKCSVEDLNLNEDTFAGCPCPKDTWSRTYYHEESDWYRDVVSDTTRLVRIEATCQVPGAQHLISHYACDAYDQCTFDSYSPIGNVPDPPPIPTRFPTEPWEPTEEPTPEPTASPTPTPTSEPAPNLPVDSAVITPTNGAVFSNTNPIDVEGKAFAEDYLQGLSVAGDGVPFHTESWPAWPDPAAVTETEWSTTFSPLGEGSYVLDAEATDWSARTQTTTHPITLTVDLLPPAPPTFDTTVVTTSRRVAQGAALLSGGATDSIGVADVDVNPDDQGWGAAVLDDVSTTSDWTYVWSIDEEDPDGATFDVTARTTDLGGHTNSTTAPIFFDLASPSPVTVTLSYTDLLSVGHAVEPREVITDGNLLTLEWTPATDGSGVAGYWVDWSTNPVSTTEAVFVPVGTLYSYSEVATEPSEMYAHVIPVDTYGNRREQVLGPVYVDAPLTPDLLKARTPPGLLYHGWCESGCTQLGVNRRVPDNAWGGASLADEQRVFATWDHDAFRLAWAGAHWDYEGDMFVYLDTKPGGATQLYNPYAGPAPGIYLPGNFTLDELNDLTEFDQVRNTDAFQALSSAAMQADYLVWVDDSQTSALLEWNSTTEGWDLQRWLGEDQVQMSLDQLGGDAWTPVTDIYLPFDQLGISTPATNYLGLLAVASEEDVLSLWSTFPERNPVTSDIVVNPLAAVAEVSDFAMLHAYRWESLAPLLCPNAAAWQLPDADAELLDSDLRAEVIAMPTGTSYSLVGDDLFWRWRDLFEAPGAKSQQFTFLDNDHPPLGHGDVVTYVVQVTNHGTSTAEGVQATVRAYNALSLEGGTPVEPSYMEWANVVLGVVAPGETVSTTVGAVVDVDGNWRYDRCITVDGLPVDVCGELLGWALLDVVVYDSVAPADGVPGIPTSPPLEFIWVDHEIDLEPPTNVGFAKEPFVLGPGEQVLRGNVEDRSAVSWVEVEITDPLGGVSTTVCPDDVPMDGRWSCPVTLAHADGDEISLRVRAADRHGHVSDWSSPSAVMVFDAVPPDVTLDDEDRTAVQGQIIGPAGHTLDGTYYDEHLGGVVQACRDVEGDVACDDAVMVLAGDVPTDTRRVFDDVPGTPPTIDSQVGCTTGGITRTFAVAESFVVGDVDLGITADHPNRGELVVELLSPGGMRVRAIDVDASSYGFANFDVWLDDAGSSPVHGYFNDDTSEPHYDRVARPDSALSAFDGEASAGAWTLRVCDTVSGTNEGSYLGGRLSIAPRSTDRSVTGTWSYALPIVDGADGLEQSLSLYGIDDVGNTTAEPITLTYVLDVVRPQLTAVQVASEILVPGPHLVLEGTVTDGGGLKEVYIRVDPPDSASYRGTTGRAGDAWSFVLLPEEAGTYTLFVEAVDRAGNLTTDGPFTVEVAESAIPTPTPEPTATPTPVPTPTPAPGDVDGDGVPDVVEDGAPNGGDGNSDGVLDYTQGNVASLPNAVDGAYLTLVAPEGMHLSSVQALLSPSLGSLPAGAVFPVGFVAFDLATMPSPPAAVAVTLLLERPEETIHYWRYGPEPAWPPDHFYRFDPLAGSPAVGATIVSDTRIDFVFVDGARGDDDLSVNGILVDQGGPARYEDPTAVRLTSFDVSVIGREVHLNWATGSESNVLGFRVMRKTWGLPQAVPVDRDLLVAEGSAARGATYELVDRPGLGRHTYTLEVVNADGTSEVLGQERARVGAPGRPVPPLH